MSAAAASNLPKGDGPTAYPRTSTLAKGITSGLRAAMERDPKVVLMGEDIGKLGPSAVRVGRKKRDRNIYPRTK